MTRQGANGHRGRLTLSECVIALGRTVSRSTLERAVSAGDLPSYEGHTRGGKPCVVVSYSDLMQWQQRRSDEDAAADVMMTTTDDDVRSADEGMALHQATQERLSATLRDVQGGAIAEVARQLEPLLDRLERTGERMSALSERAGRLEAENAQLRAALLEARQRAGRVHKGRGLLRRLLGG